MKVLLAPSFDLALSAPKADVTIEAEYGGIVMEGLLYTAAHHQPTGPYAGRHVVQGGRPSPCNDPAIPEVFGDGIILVSHIDLDTLGGVIRALGRHSLYRLHRSFWELAEAVDVHGPHRLEYLEGSAEDIRRLYAFWAWSKGAPRFPRDAVTDITGAIEEAVAVLAEILHGVPERLAAGDAFRAGEAELNRRTFRSMTPDLGIIVRVAESASDFCNHLYADPEGMSGGDSAGRHAVVVCHNTATGAITISISEPLPGFSCRELVQALWGPEAGGHDGIAGSPRGRVMTEDDLWRMTMLVDSALCDCLAAQATA